MPFKHDWSHNNNRHKLCGKSEINGFRPFFKFPGDGVYVGKWKRNKPDNHGKKIYSNGLIYDGQWKMGRRHGEGILRKPLPDGRYERIYIGGWKDDQKHGEGRKFFKNGFYHGFWENNVRSGYGIMWYDSGAVYMGNWLNDKYHGMGVLVQSKIFMYKMKLSKVNIEVHLEDRNRYEGYFENGLKEGEGTFFHNRKGQIQEGMWKSGVCKTSVIVDYFRNLVENPTPYPLPPIELANLQGVITDSFREHFSEERKKGNILEVPKTNYVSRIKKKLDTYSAF